MLIHLVTLRPTGNKPPVVSAYDFLLMACYICKHNVIIRLWILNLIRDFQHYAELSQFKQNPWDYRGVSPSFEVSERPLFLFFWPPEWKWEVHHGFNFLSCIVIWVVGNYDLTRIVFVEAYVPTLCICKRKIPNVEKGFICRETIYSVVKLHNMNFPPCCLCCMNSLMRYLQPPTLIH